MRRPGCVQETKQAQLGSSNLKHRAVLVLALSHFLICEKNVSRKRATDKIARYQTSPESMMCTPIKLSNRSMRPNERDLNKYRSKLLEEKFCMKSDYYHSYTFRWDRSKKFINTPTDTNHSLAVNNINLPENAPSFNTGSSLERWSTKRPRLKSCKNLTPLDRGVSPKETESDDTFNVAALIDKFSREIEAENEAELESQEIDEGLEEIDPDIQRLISISQGSSTEPDDEDNYKRRKKHKKKKKEESGKKVKVLRFSLSKPPSPQTVQVIRVDVTSNHSLEEEAKETNKMETDCTKGCGKRIKSGLETRKAMLKKQFSVHTDEVDFLCKKLILMERNDEENI